MGLEELQRVLTALPDRKLAAGYVLNLFQTLPPGEAAPLLEAIIASALHEESSGQMLLTVSLALASTEARGARDGLVDEARSIGLPRVLRLFAERPAHKSLEDGDARLNVPDFGRGRPLSLGERKSVARTRDRQLLARVVRDPDPDVVRILLGNPALTEADVVRMCSRRPSSPDVLREIFRSARWLVRRSVQVALVKNPWLPIDLGQQLVPHVGAVERRQLVESPELADEIRMAAAGTTNIVVDA